MRYYIFRAFQNGYRIRLRHWHPDSYWYKDDFAGYIMYSGVTKETQPLVMTDITMEYMICENWEIIKPDTFCAGEPIYKEDIHA